MPTLDGDSCGTAAVSFAFHVCVYDHTYRCTGGSFTMYSLLLLSVVMAAIKSDDVAIHYRGIVV